MVAPGALRSREGQLSGQSGGTQNSGGFLSHSRRTVCGSAFVPSCRSRWTNLWKCGRQPPCLLLWGLGLRSASRVSQPAYWASWADSLVVIGQRHPTVASKLVRELEEMPSTPFLNVAVEARRHLTARWDLIRSQAGWCPPIWRPRFLPICSVWFSCAVSASLSPCPCATSDVAVFSTPLAIIKQLGWGCSAVGALLWRALRPVSVGTGSHQHVYERHGFAVAGGRRKETRNRRGRSACTRTTQKKSSTARWGGD